MIAALLLAGIAGYAQVSIKLEDINKHVGDSVTVCGKVFGGIFLEKSKNTPTFLNVGDAYPANPLTIVIWGDLRKEFTEKPEEFYKGREVCVTGKVELYKGKPEIILNSRNQLTVKE